MKILHIIPSFSQGGAQTYTMRYCHYDKDNKHYVIGINGKTGVLEESFPPNTITIHKPIGYLGKNWKWLYKFLKKEEIDSVWCVNGGLLLVVARLAGVKTRITFYRNSTTHIEHDPFRLRTAYLKLSYKLNPIISTALLSNSYTAIKNYHPTLARKDKGFKVIYNGINLDSISKLTKEQSRSMLKLPNNAFVIGHSGRLHYVKNHDMIIKVALELCSRYKNLYFILVGDGVFEKYGEVVGNAGLSDKIRMLGFRQDVMDILMSLDLFYFPSLTEGQPNSLIEAMVSGIPFVASDIMPIKETTPEWLHGQLVPCNDYNKNLNAIETMYLQKDKLEDFSCKEWAMEHFNAKKQFELFKDELESEI